MQSSNSIPPLPSSLLSIVPPLSPLLPHLQCLFGASRGLLQAQRQAEQRQWEATLPQTLTQALTLTLAKATSLTMAMRAGGGSAQRQLEPDRRLVPSRALHQRHACSSVCVSESVCVCVCAVRETTA